MKILLYGGTGWIGTKLYQILTKNTAAEIILGQCRLQDYGYVQREVNRVEPTHVINCAGLTGRPNVDWCEDHKVEVLQANLIGATALAEYCSRNGIHHTYMGTGCIFEYDAVNHNCPLLITDSGTDPTSPENSVDKYDLTNTTGFTEQDSPNFTRSFYSYTKAMTENVLKHLPKVLILRIRMPISDDLHERSFVTKITKYQKVVNVPNSMSVLSELLPLIPDMVVKEKTGIYNFTNPGVISHNQVLQLYKQHVDPNFTWQNFTLIEQDQILKAPRSNNYLDASKLKQEYPQINDIYTAMEQVMRKIGNNK